MSSYVYIISDGTDIKIGKSNKPQQRLKELQTGNKKQLSIIRLIETKDEEEALTLESGLHSIYSYYKINNEWFSGKILNNIQQYSDIYLKNRCHKWTEEEVFLFLKQFISEGLKTCDIIWFLSGLPNKKIKFHNFIKKYFIINEKGCIIDTKVRG